MDKVDFCQNMAKYCNPYSDYYYPIKRSFGQTLNTCPMDAVIAYANISTTKNPVIQNKEFLVAGLCYNVAHTTTYDKDDVKYVKIEQLLHRLVMKDETRKKEISKFLQLTYDNNGYFSKVFYTLCKKLIPLLHSNEQIDYINLLNDLIYWDNGVQVKMRWAMATVFNEKEENNDKEGN
jgi:hypothetical protein